MENITSNTTVTTSLYNTTPKLFSLLGRRPYVKQFQLIANDYYSPWTGFSGGTRATFYNYNKRRWYRIPLPKVEFKAGLPGLKLPTNTVVITDNYLFGKIGTTTIQCREQELNKFLAFVNS